MTDALLIRWLRQQEKHERNNAYAATHPFDKGYCIGLANGYASTITFLQRRKRPKKAKAA